MTHTPSRLSTSKTPARSTTLHDSTLTAPSCTRLPHLAPPALPHPLPHPLVPTLLAPLDQHQRPAQEPVSSICVVLRLANIISICICFCHCQHCLCWSPDHILPHRWCYTSNSRCWFPRCCRSWSTRFVRDETFLGNSRTREYE